MKGEINAPPPLTIDIMYARVRYNHFDGASDGGIHILYRTCCMLHRRISFFILNEL